MEARNWNDILQVQKDKTSNLKPNPVKISFRNATKIYTVSDEGKLWEIFASKSDLQEMLSKVV